MKMDKQDFNRLQIALENITPDDMAEICKRAADIYKLEAKLTNNPILAHIAHSNHIVSRRLKKKA